jgi:hypothetical protein
MGYPYEPKTPHQAERVTTDESGRSLFPKEASYSKRTKTVASLRKRGNPTNTVRSKVMSIKSLVMTLTIVLSIQFSLTKQSPAGAELQ